jgi:hypothetical protein
MRIFSLLLVLGLLSACKSKEATTQASAAKAMRQLKWICGTWYNETEKGTLYEVWAAKGASEYNGFSFFISGNDTLFSESIIIPLYLEIFGFPDQQFLKMYRPLDLSW